MFSLKKVLYRLKQASRECYLYLHKFLVSIGFEQSQADLAPYDLREDAYLALFLACSDDILILSRTDGTGIKIIKQFANKFKKWKFTKIDCFLKMSVKKDGKSVKLHNEPMIKRVLGHFNVINCKLADTLPPPNLNLEVHDELMADQPPYQQLVGILMHLTNTVRPDICNGVNCLAGYMYKPSKKLWAKSKYILRNLQGTSSLVITYREQDALNLNGYSNSDWAQEHPD